MKQLFNLKELSNKSITAYEGLLLAISAIFVIPYFILSYFDNPTNDDYSFAIKYFDLGYWGSQVSAYNTWNGRYFSSFILCLNPLSFNLIVYKIIPILLLAFTIHSLYYFISNCFELKNKVVCFVLAIAITFWYLDKMPTLVQGIYWASSSITYHLGNIVMLYLLTNIYIIVFKPERSIKFKKIVSAFLIIAGCGSNESIMLIIILLVLLVLAYYVIIERKINKLFLMYFCLSIICFLVLFSSPGGVIREKDFIDPNTKNVFFTIMSSFANGTKYIVGWIFSLQTFVLSIFLILSYFTWSNSIIKTKNSIIYALLALVVGYLLVIATFSPGFWATARVAPDRSINCSYWLFVIMWSVILFFITSFVASTFKWFKKINYSPIILLSMIGLLITAKASGNYYNAWSDLVCGKAYIYNKECKNRVEIMKASSDSVMIDIPAFSAYPRSVFNVDLDADDFNWWNREYAKYYHRKAVRLIQKDPCASHKTLITFDDLETEALSNTSAITKELSFSEPNSTLQPGPDSYSAIFLKAVKDMNITNPTEISNVDINAVIYSKDSLINAVLVFSITDPAGKTVFWFGKEIAQSHYPTNKWTKESFNIPIMESSIMESQNKISVYMWNRGRGKVYMDDLSINIY